MGLDATALAQSLFPGSWELESHVRTRGGREMDDGDGEFLDAAASGSLQYSADGYMTALVTSTHPDRRPRELTLQSRPGDHPDHRWALIGKHSLAYSGPYSIESAAYENLRQQQGDAGGGGGDGPQELPMDAELTGVVIHGEITTATLPSFVGSRQKRNFTFSDKGQKLTLWASADDVVDTLIWLKAPPRKTVG